MIILNKFKSYLIIKIQIPTKSHLNKFKNAMNFANIVGKYTFDLMEIIQFKKWSSF